MAIVTLRYWAAAKEAAGIAEETISAETLADALAAAGGRAASGGHAGGGGSAEGGGQAASGGQAGRDSRLRAILARSSFLIDGLPVGTRAPEAVALSDASVIEVLPPFAGG
jgi:sulfur-carrier protein